MTDPRAENCRAFTRDDQGRVDGVLIEYERWPDRKYELDYVGLIPEASAGGQTVAQFEVLNADGDRIFAPVALGWPWQGLGTSHWDDYTTQATNGQHMVSGGPFNPPAVGPLAMWVNGGPGLNPISDVVGGLGLPNRRHVSFVVRFRERRLTPLPPGPGPVPPPPDGGEMQIVIQPGERAVLTVRVESVK